MPRSSKDKPQIESKPNTMFIVTDIINRFPRSNVLVPASGSTASSSTPPNVLGPNEQMENDSTAQPPTEDDVGQAPPYKKSWMSSTVFIGQDRAYNQLCNFLKDDKVGMVGIYGMGGVGKTNLMKEVDEKFLTPSKFEVIWIDVSKTVDMDAIQKVIMRYMSLSFNKHDYARNRAKKINSELRRHKVALLFDDIWKCLDLEQLILGPENLDRRTFKLIFTTRSEDVCEQMGPHQSIKVQCLEWDDSWALFKRSVKNNDIESCDSRIEELAKEVAKECKGLPLALKVIGGAMACRKRVEEWRHALATLQRRPTDIPDAEDDLFARLKFSFDSLSNRREKACFLYACLYPEDTTLPASFLVECWIGQGILTLDGSYQEAFDEGMNIFGTLQTACLFERVGLGDASWGLRTRIHDAWGLRPRIPDEWGLGTRIHDVIRDMGIWISKSPEMMNLITLDDGVSRREKTEPHRFSVWYKDVESEWPEKDNSINLTTLFIPVLWPDATRSQGTRRKLRSCTLNFFAFMSKLRVIRVEEVNFHGCPTSIGELTELRHLELISVGLDGFPKEIRNLRKLQVMRYSSCSSCEMIDLPVEIGILTELRKLDVRGSEEDMDDEVDCGPVEMTGSEEEDMDDEVAFASFLTQLSALQQPIFLDMKCFPIKEFQVPPTSNTSCIFPRLSRVRIFGFPNLEKMQVMSPMALPSICVLEISSCCSLKHISGLEHLQRLEALKISGCKNLGEVIEVAGEEANHSRPICFPKLKQLKCSYLRQVKSICSDTVSFPSLQDFTCYDCPGLTRLPRGLVKKNGAAPEKCSISGEREWYNKLQWQDRDFKAALDPFIRAY